MISLFFPSICQPQQRAIRALSYPWFWIYKRAWYGGKISVAQHGCTWLWWSRGHVCWFPTWIHMSSPSDYVDMLITCIQLKTRWLPTRGYQNGTREMATPINIDILGDYVKVTRSLFTRVIIWINVILVDRGAIVYNVPLIHPTTKPWNNMQPDYNYLLTWHRNQLYNPWLRLLEVIWDEWETNLSRVHCFVERMRGTLTSIR